MPAFVLAASPPRRKAFAERSPAVRPHRYHRKGERDPYLHALRRLHRRGWSDARIAEALSRLTSKDIERLTRYRLWTEREIEAALQDLPIARPWTVRQVSYWRHKLRLKGNPFNHELGKSPAAIRSCYVRRDQVRSRWGHLLPEQELRRSEIAVLSVLRDHGPCTSRQIAGVLGKSPSRRLRIEGQPVLTRLKRAGLIEQQGRNRGGAPLYTISAAAARPLPGLCELDDDLAG